MLSAQPAYALARATFKRAQRGLFGGKHIQFGNNVHVVLMNRRIIPNVDLFFFDMCVEPLLQEKD